MDKRWVMYIQRAINNATHPLSCNILRGHVCSCNSQARAVIELAKKRKAAS